ncbi:putative signal transducing protein [Wenyingzhuangia sp. IMCC45533]
MGYTKVFSGSLVEVQHVKQVLQERGIEPIVKDHSNSAMMAGFGAVLPNYQELFVRDDETEAVLNFIKNM